MDMAHRPGNEPDPGDMSTDPGTGAPNEEPREHDLPDDEAEKLGNFASFEHCLPLATRFSLEQAFGG